MRQSKTLLGYLVLLILLSCPVQAQNWTIVIQDNAAGTPVNQVNGSAGGPATLYATIFNFTGTGSSDDGTESNTPAPATTVDFAGFGFTQNPGQDDLANLFTADSRIPGYPVVEGSLGGSIPGTSGYLVLGTFDLASLKPGVYQEDFTASAYPDDINSTVPFDDISGTLTLNVQGPAAVPEPSTITTFSIGVLSLLLFAVRRRSKRTGQSV